MTPNAAGEDLVMGRPRAEVAALSFEDFWKLVAEHQAREAVAEKARRQAYEDRNRDDEARFRAVLVRLDNLIAQMKETNRRLIARRGLKPEDLVRREPFRP